MWTLITDCDGFMKFKNKSRNLTLYFNKTDNRISSVDVFDDESGSGLTIERVDRLDPELSELIDNEVLKFISSVLETEKER